MIELTQCQKISPFDLEFQIHITLILGISMTAMQDTFFSDVFIFKIKDFHT